MYVSEAGTQAIVMNLRSEGQTSRADYVEALWQALLVAWNDIGEYTRQYSELQEATNSLIAELAAARELAYRLVCANDIDWQLKVDGWQLNHDTGTIEPLSE